ncbi:MAG: signal peptidase I [Verrucomicrobia bacterium]|nr:signal peptidase I [Verrucomicrobiota bacterium]
MNLLKAPLQLPQRLYHFIHSRYVPHESRPAYVLACLIAWSLLSFILVSKFLLGSVEVDGPSMEPTLHNGSRFLVNRWVYFFRAPRRNELVILRDHLDDNLCIKRVVALPGETIEFRHGRVYLNDELLTEAYLGKDVQTWTIKTSLARVKIPADHYFVLGDNRANSIDGRTYGPLHREDILGLVNH